MQQKENRTRRHVGIVHPGEMGISIAASAKNSEQFVCWASEGRSTATRARAEEHRLDDARTVAELCERCSIIISVCPPHAAESVADEVMAAGFRGLFVEANAISPQRSIAIGERMSKAGVTFIDGGIIGFPAWKPGATWLYLSGPGAEEIAECFSAGPLMTSILGSEAGKASALKMCYAAYTKGTTALLSAIVATAERMDVRAALFDQWTRDDASFVQQVEKRIRNGADKAWRFAGEMEEISSTFAAAGLPGEFHQGAAIVYRRLERFKDAGTAFTLKEVLAALLENPKIPV